MAQNVQSSSMSWTLNHLWYFIAKILTVGTAWLHAQLELHGCMHEKLRIVHLSRCLCHYVCDWTVSEIHEKCYPTISHCLLPVLPTLAGGYQFLWNHLRTVKITLSDTSVASLLQLFSLGNHALQSNFSAVWPSSDSLCILQYGYYNFNSYSLFAVWWQCLQPHMLQAILFSTFCHIIIHRFQASHMWLLPGNLISIWGK